MVVHSINASAKDLPKFSAGSKVTQYPVEHISDFLKMFGVEHGWGEEDTETALTDTNLGLTTWEIITPREWTSFDRSSVVRELD